MFVKLDCCSPLTQWGSGGIVVHGPGCEGPGAETPLTGDEWRECLERARSMRDHPAGTALPPRTLSWTEVHDKTWPYGCGQPACYRCDSTDDNPPYAEELV